MNNHKFLATNLMELHHRGISRPDVVLITGDAYIDSSFCGTAIIGRVLEAEGYSVGIISQPDISTGKDITALGEPRLFWGVSSGCVDSEIANYTSLGKPRRSCDFTPGGKNNRRPDRACIVYSNLIRRHFKNTVPIVLGGIEASLRRTAHYDPRTNKIRRSILLDAKADILVYGMGEAPVLEIAGRLSAGQGLEGIRGTCVMQNAPEENSVALPDYDAIPKDKQTMADMFRLFYQNSTGPGGSPLAQKYGSRFLVQNPPAPLPSRQELDRIYELPYTNQVHPMHKSQGHVRAMDTIRNSITTHRGCYGECSFCSIAIHQGRSVISRSMDSIVREAQYMLGHDKEKGVINDVGGPTANMYGSGCSLMASGKPCQDRRCTGYDGVCSRLVHGHHKQKRLLNRLRALTNAKQITIASGIRFDLVLSDKKHGSSYLEQVIKHHVSGQMKIAPEHSVDHVLKLMNKPRSAHVWEFARLYRRLASKLKRNVHLSCYVIAAHPGCTIRDMKEFAGLAQTNLKFSPEQVQIFTPAPSTRSTIMYHCGVDPFTGKKVWSEKGIKGKQEQKLALKRKK
ncbi:YgiQ family radical SAM protein [Desulfonatronovibrio magnus]|uniref:YgiQ family radical SAM protein n=1 Tax=Desulfonatronovibrio magnus TaxID=698827 RepID=UPI0005EAD084|nr:YgiQ family radical SAM protein [Desulfonatronovibrio magnus]